MRQEQSGAAMLTAARWCQIRRWCSRDDVRHYSRGILRLRPCGPGGIEVRHDEQAPTREESRTGKLVSNGSRISVVDERREAHFGALRRNELDSASRTRSIELRTGHEMKIPASADEGEDELDPLFGSAAQVLTGTGPDGLG